MSTLNNNQKGEIATILQKERNRQMARAAFIYKQRPRRAYFSAPHMHKHEQHTQKTVRHAGKRPLRVR